MFFPVSIEQRSGLALVLSTGTAATNYVVGSLPSMASNFVEVPEMLQFF
jgi:hypothetical protein